MSILNRNSLPFLAIIAITAITLAWFVYSFFRSNPNTEVPSANESQTPSSLSEQTDEQGAVTVKVKPLNVSQDAEVWEFEVTLDTHSVELDTDLAEDAVLIVNATEYLPLSWTGDPPGGHHRKGVLKFQSLSSSSVIQLKMRGVAGVAERVFQWNTK